MTNKVDVKELVIEEINRNHKLLHRHKIDKPCINIGRDYHNDIILADPHVCPSHISIDYIDKQWQITDNHTINGTFIENSKEKKQDANQHIVRDGDVINLGKSQLRLLFSDHAVAPTVAFSPFESFINLMRHPVALFISIAFFTIIAGSIIYFNKPIEVNFSQLLVPAIGITLGFALWPAGVALVSHFTKNDARLMAQLAVSFVLFNLMWFSSILENIVTFNSSGNNILPIFMTFTSVMLAFGLFWLNSYIGFHMSSKRRIVISACLTILLFGGSYLIQYSKKPDFNPRPNYNATIMMPSFLLTTSSNVDEFIEDSSKLFDKTSKKAQEE
ncbi:FHA domain-containing protein [Candidatus Colwellia aromaticivorans]|uniref:FHA domain-containing protein n=1 Tax=Candidatus Colwellia aromaticivorans TaxID=2267621 RepID=UPI0014446720|nr:FHA domain-containing protein [Candidatus Colwellia aromaticivorans]